MELRRLRNRKAAARAAASVRPPFVSQTSVLRSFHQGEEDGPERLHPEAGVHPAHLPTVSVSSASFIAH